MNPSAAAFGEAHAVKCELAEELLRSSGTVRLRVTGRSMLPSIWPGDTLLLEAAACDDISTGDVVVFSHGRQFVAHRVVSAGGTAHGATIQSHIQTQGDALDQADVPLSKNDLLAKVSLIVRNGKSIQPRRSLRPVERAVAKIFRRSDIAARVVARVHNLRQSLRNERQGELPDKAAG
jgi:signal peptidase I